MFGEKFSGFGKFVVYGIVVIGVLFILFLCFSALGSNYELKRIEAISQSKKPVIELPNGKLYRLSPVSRK